MFEDIEDIWTRVRNFNEYSKTLVTLATTVGALVITIFVIKVLYRLSLVFRLYVWSRINCCQVDYAKKYGQWAVISGATDGIGLAMAKDLARRGMSIVVIGRNEEKLANTKTMLENEANAGEIVTVKIDLSDSSLDNFDRITSQIDPDNRDIGMLINNAGTFPSKFRRFNKISADDLRTIVNLNILATLYLTRMIMPSMVKRGKGLVVNVSSILGTVPAPYMSVYGATKTFVDAFSRQLQIEYSTHPIDIINLTPGAVHTKLLTATSNLPRPSLLNPTPEDYAKSALAALATGIGEYSGTPFHGFNKLSVEFFDYFGLMPFFFGLNLRFNAQDIELSPVPKRRKLSQVADSYGG